MASGSSWRSFLSQSITASTSGGTESEQGRHRSVKAQLEQNMYLRERAAHEVMEEAVEVSVAFQFVAEELKCAICLQILNKTWATKDCIHRFCHSCITKALTTRKECPVCERKLVGMRSLRPDPSFDRLIATIYPPIQNNNTSKGKSKRKGKSDSTCSSSLSTTVANASQGSSDSSDSSHGGSHQSHPPSTKRKASSATDGPEAKVCRVEESKPSGRDVNSEVELILKPHPNLSNVELAPLPLKQIRYLKTVGDATVDHISNYVATRVKLDIQKGDIITNGAESGCEKAGRFPLASEYHIFINPSSGMGGKKCYTPLDGSWSLEEVRDRFWKVKRPLELQFLVDSLPSTNNTN